VSEQTEGRIEDLIPQGALTPQTILVLANAVYFNAAWARPFDETDTRPGNFHLLDDSVVQVPMMSQEALFRYALLEGLQAVELPYVGNEVAMVILLPDGGQFEEFEAGLSAGRLAEILQALQPGMVELTMPKFEYRTEYSLADVLGAMGMPSAFSGADFSGMDGGRGLFISEIFHKAFISVDEARTEAAAATGVIAPSAIMEGPGPITVDHPFVFVLRDIPTGSILFVGRVLDPAG
jgi:serpin B